MALDSGGVGQRLIFLLIIFCFEILAFVPIPVNRGEYGRHSEFSYFRATAESSDVSASATVTPPYSSSMFAQIENATAGVPFSSVFFNKPDEKKHITSSSSSSSSSLIQSLQSTMNSDDFAIKLYKYALKKTVLSNYEKNTIALETRKRCKDFSLHHSASIIWTIGTLKLPVRNPDISLICDFLLEKFNEKRSILTASDLSLLLLGLARLGVKWRPGSNGKTFLSSLGHLASYMDDQQLSNSVWALGKIDVTWDRIDSKARRALIESIKKSAPKMTAQGIANTIHGLSNIRTKWSNLPSPLLEVFFSCTFFPLPILWTNTLLLD